MDYHSWSGFAVASKPPLGLSVAVLAGMALAGAARVESQIPGPPPGAQGARASVTGTGVLVGQTIDGVTGRPISGALVAISATPGNLETLGPGDAVPIDRLLSMDFGSIFAGVRQALTDDQGRFAFTSLPKGSFSLTATKPGWLGGGYSQRTPGGSGAPVVLGEGERVGNITLQLWRNAAIAGTVIDEAGEPVVGLTVRALRRTWIAGRPRFSLGGAGQTDDRGVYRITSLRPGDYIAVVAQTPMTTPASGSAPGLDPAAIQNMIMSNGPGTDPNALMASIGALASGANAGGIRAGDWMLQTSSVGSRLIPPVVTADGHIVGYRTTFYPNATSAAQAVSVAVGAAEERPSIDFQLTAVSMVRVSGTISGPEGSLGNTTLRLVPGGTEDLATESGFESATATTNANGQFTFLAVPPGQYTLKILRTPRANPPGPAAAANLGMSMIQSASGGVAIGMEAMGMDMIAPAPPIPSEPTLWASMPIGVANTDIAGLSVALRVGFRISGRAEFDGSATRPAPALLKRVPIFVDRVDSGGVAPTPLASLGLSQNGQFDENGQFTTYGLVPGKYFVRVPFSLGEWTLKSATVGGRDVADSPLEIDDGDVSGVVLTFTDRATELSGVVRNDQGQPDSNASVLVFPPTADSWVDFGSAPRRLRLARTGRDGQYRIARLPAGDYLIAAVRSEVAGEWQNPTFLQSLARTATRVTIGDGEKKAQELHTSR
jgi:protocatechuate 3,4-dioxygenase beta subunit